VYVTNVVKHFKWQPRGKRRIHETPNRAEITACLPWLRAEVQVVGPRVVVALGATAAKALLGPGFRVSAERGRLIQKSAVGVPVIATVHPSSILRMEEREAATEAFVKDLSAVAEYLRP
jgi:DNA polymerase